MHQLPIHSLLLCWLLDKERERRGKLRLRATARESHEMVPLLVGPKLILLSLTLTQRRQSATIATKYDIGREVAQNTYKPSGKERSIRLSQVFTQLDLMIHLMLSLGFLIPGVVTTFVLNCRD